MKAAHLKLATTLLIASTLAWPAQAEEATPGVSAEVSTASSPRAGGKSATRDPVEVAGDALVVRPVGFAATIVGAAVYVVALPFAAIAGDVPATGRALVGAPAHFTFKRKLGDFEHSTLK